MIGLTFIKTYLNTLFTNVSDLESEVLIGSNDPNIEKEKSYEYKWNVISETYRVEKITLKFYISNMYLVFYNYREPIRFE